VDGEITRALVELLTPLVTAAATALGLWAASKLPGPARELLEANVHRQDIQRLVEAMQRRALAEVANHATPPPSPAEIIDYLGRVRGDLLRKMDVAPEALATMAQAAIATATIATTAPAVVAPADVLVSSGDLSRALHRSVTPGG
jgi:hypothetical protein